MGKKIYRHSRLFKINIYKKIIDKYNRMNLNRQKRFLKKWFIGINAPNKKGFQTNSYNEEKDFQTNSHNEENRIIGKIAQLVKGYFRQNRSGKKQHYRQKVLKIRNYRQNLIDKGRIDKSLIGEAHGAVNSPYTEE